MITTLGRFWILDLSSTQYPIQNLNSKIPNPEPLSFHQPAFGEGGVTGAGNDKVVVHRVVRDQVRIRIVWRGGDTSTTDIPIPVGAFAELSHGTEMKARLLALARQGLDDGQIANILTAEGYRSPLHQTVLPSTVKGIRLKDRIFIKRSQSHPRHVPGFLTVPQVARMFGVTTYWVYDRIHNGTLAIARDQNTGLYLFPDEPHTLQQLKQLAAASAHPLGN